MLARINKAIAKKDSGFTLIELLVVVIIIGILAAIAIPTFLNQREAGWRAQATSNLRNAVTNAETFAVNNNGSYALLPTAATADDAVNRGIARLGGTALVTVAAPTATTYCLQVIHPSYGTAPADVTRGTFSYRKATDAITQGGC